MRSICKKWGMGPVNTTWSCASWELDDDRKAEYAADRISGELMEVTLDFDKSVEGELIFD